MTYILLILAAALEVGGDAFIRTGLKGTRPTYLILGAVTLIVYGFMVNLTNLDFSRLMGLYIVVFFLVSQLTAVGIFREHLPIPVLVGGTFILLGGLTMTLWRAK